MIFDSLYWLLLNEEPSRENRKFRQISEYTYCHSGLEPESSPLGKFWMSDQARRDEGGFFTRSSKRHQLNFFDQAGRSCDQRPG
jgi:hypothetical protein